MHPKTLGAARSRWQILCALSKSAEPLGSFDLSLSVDLDQRVVVRHLSWLESKALIRRVHYRSWTADSHPEVFDADAFLD